MPQLKDLTGQTFGRLTVIRRAGNADCGNVRWLCKCDCGNITTPSGQSLRSGLSLSCGCLQKEIASKITTKHGESKTRLYKIWAGIIVRCYKNTDAKYHLYGGRGIKVCAEWRNSYVAFRNWALSNGYSDSLTIDRINGGGDYEPINCRWADVVTQNNNTSRNRFVSYLGKTQTIAQWASEYNMPYERLYTRIRRGWGISEALMKGVG